MAKKAGFAGRITGTLRPKYVASCSQLFEKRGDAWLSPREKDREFPLRRSRPADTPTSSEQIRADQARQKMKLEMHEAKIKRVREELFKVVEDRATGVIPSSIAQHETARLMDTLIELNEAKGKITVEMKPPQPRLHVDPDLDFYTQAERVRPKKEHHDVQGKAIEACPQRKATNAILAMRRGMRANKAVEVKERHGSPHKVKGSFYKFPDVAEKIQDNTRYEPRPFFGQFEGKKK